MPNCYQLMIDVYYCILCLRENNGAHTTYVYKVSTYLSAKWKYNNLL